MWYLPWSESIKKRACRYLLQRYLGNFLEEKLTLNQLSVDLYNGTGTVCDVSLDCEALNELGDSQNWPLEIVDGYMKEITVTIPWSTLLKDDSVVEVNGLSLTVQPKIRTEPASSMLESMWSSMSSSMQLAEECLKEEPPQDTNPLEGIEMVAQAIDSVLNRVKIRFLNTLIRIEHVPKNSDRGIALEVHIDSVDYFDEAGSEPSPGETDPDKSKTYVEATFVNKKIRFVGVSLYTDEFPSKLRTMARSLISERSEHSPEEKDNQHSLDVNYQSTSSDVFYETRSIISAIETETYKDVDDMQSTLSEKSIEVTLEDRSNQPDPILFAKITGQQDLSLKMRHTKEVDSPKVEVKMTMGSFIIFISPRQLHTLFELVNALNQPHLEDTSNIPLRASGATMQCKPMQKADYQLIEAQLLRNFEMGHKYTGMQGWSGPGLEVSDADGERFHPLTSPGANMAESFSSSVSSMNTSCTSSVSAPALARNKRNKKFPFVEGDPSADVSLISLRIQSLSCVLLHKDILIPEIIGSDCIRASTIEKMQEISKEFFKTLKFPPLIEGTREEFYNAIEEIEKAAGRNHLRLITTEMSLDGSEKTTSHGSQMMCEASIKHLLLQECLYSKYTEDSTVTPQSFDLVQFDWKEDEDPSQKTSRSSQENVKISFKQTSKYTRIAGEKKLLNPTTDISVRCMPFHVDVELSLIERMSATFFSGPTSPTCTPPPPGQAQSHCNVTLHSSTVHATLRFPIADLRSNVNREYRRVRNDFLVFKFLNSTINWQRVASSRPQPTAVTVKATALDLYYYEDERVPATHIARATMDECSESNILKGSSAPIPTITLTFQPSKTSTSPFDSMSEDHFQPAGNPMTTSMYIMNNLKSTQPSPFSGKKMAHQSFTKHEGSPHGQEENLIVPGTEEEMAEFTNSSIDLSSIHLDFNLPILSLQLESKQLYEILYNRINSDLLLWEPHLIDPYEYNPDVYGPINPAFGACKNNLYDSDSGSTSSEEDNMYYSSYDNKLKKGVGKTYEKKDTHNFCLTFKTGKGLLNIYAPVRDSNKRVVPGQMGEMVLEVHKLSMCHLSGLYGQPKTGQMCLRSRSITLYHEATVTIPSEKPSLRIFGSSLPSYLKSTIYPSGKGVAIKEQLPENDMFSLALKVNPDKENPNLKAICIALGIEQASLRHRGDKGIAWLTQLMDVLDVIDYPVPGYTPSTVVSELHVHILDCAIDYRPLYLPIRTVLTLGNFAVSSNVITETNTSCLRFLAQECTLFIMNVAGSKPLVAVPLDDDKLPNIKRDYVCVVDVGLFELSLRMEDKENSSREQPQVDLSASNNLITIYTCWDSASALCRLLTYAASDGDSQPPYVPSSRHTSICSDQPIETLVGLEDRPIEDVRELSPSELQQVNDMMAEAMKESPNTTFQDEDFNSPVEKEGVEVFFFPDESNLSNKQSSLDSIENDMEVKPFAYEDFCSGVPEDFHEVKPTNVQVATELGDPSTTPKPTPRKSKRRNTKSSSEGNNTDDEYCIIESQPQVVDSDLEEPIVKCFGNGPIPLIEEHFTIPPERTDVLKAPKSFPIPMFRYTLCEMSVMWHMYGGSDFSRGEVVPVKKTVTIDENARKQGSPKTTKRGEKEYEPYEEGRETTAAYRSRGVSWAAGSERVRPPLARAQQKGRDWRELGGPQRDHSVCVMLSLNKVKFQHEIYPPGGVQASRHTLAIHKIEILDRLNCSRINKMLTIYNLNDEPERRNAYMLVVKACHLRPDPTLSAQECCLKISLLPLRFFIDQDTLAFLISFFTKLGTDENTDDECKSLGGISCESAGSKHATPTRRPPVMSIASHLRDPPPTPTSLGDADALSINENINREDEPLMETYEAERLVNENLIQLEEDFQRLGLGQDKPAAKTTVDYEPLDDSPIYFRRIVFSPDVPIRLDYVGKRVDLSAGPIAGLLMGLGQLNCSELTLKRLDYRLGLLGVEKLIQWALREWLTDIKRHQLPGLLSGIGPMRSLLQFVTGICDLVWLPVEQWRRDGRLVHGIRRGAASFTARTAVAALDITTRLLHLIQATAETAFDMLTPGPTLQLQDAYERRERRRRRRRDPARHVADIREGVASAYQTVREGFAEQAATMALAARSSNGAGVLRHLPGAAVAPLALAAAGAADVLGGVRAHLEPHRARDHADRWRPLPDKPSD